MIEVAVVFSSYGRLVHWHEPPGRSMVWIPDSRNLWDVLWENRRYLGGVAHTHPWSRAAAPSPTDLTTFRAVEDGLGRRLVWPIATLGEVAYWMRDPDGSYSPREVKEALPGMNYEDREAWEFLVHELRAKTFKGDQHDG